MKKPGPAGLYADPSQKYFDHGPGSGQKTKFGPGPGLAGTGTTLPISKYKNSN